MKNSKTDSLLRSSKELLELTLGSMSAQHADEIVRIVIDILAQVETMGDEMVISNVPME